MACQPQGMNAELTCPITGEVPGDPVMLQVDGRVYSESALREWLRRSLTSPHTREPCTPGDIVASAALNNMCSLARADTCSRADTCPPARADTCTLPRERHAVPITECGPVSLAVAGLRDDRLFAQFKCEKNGDVVTGVDALEWSDIVMCIDRSYSTKDRVGGRNAGTGSAVESGYTINDLIRHSAKAVAASLAGTGSRVAVVAFDDRVESVSPLTEVTAANSSKLLAEIDTIEPRGSTNIWKGCREAARILMTREDTRRNPAILLLTDGQPSHGPNRPENEAIARLFPQPPQEWGCEPGPTVPVYSMGFGYSLKRGLMYRIARDTGGVNSSIPGAEMMVTAFGSALANILNTRCFSTKLHIELNDGSQWTIGRDGRIADTDSLASCTHHDDGRVTIDVLVGPLQFEQERSVFLNLTPLSDSARATVHGSFCEGGLTRETDSVVVTGEDFVAPPTRGSIEYGSIEYGSIEYGSIEYGSIEYEGLRRAACLALARMAKARERGQDQLCAGEYEAIASLALSTPGERASRLRTTWEDQVRLGAAYDTQECRRHWSEWGWIYVDQLRSALANQCSTNFKDEALRPFVTPTVAAVSDKVSDVFDVLTPTPPSRPASRPGATRAQVYNMRDFNRDSASTVCFTDCTQVRVMRRKQSSAEVAPIGSVRPGDSVLGSTVDASGNLRVSGYFAVEAVVSTPCVAGTTEVVEVASGCFATPWHPIKLGGHGWTPASSVATPAVTAAARVVTLVLERGAAIRLIPSLPSVTPVHGASLGHGCPAPGIAHSFWGTEAVLRAVRRLPDYPNVNVLPGMIQRRGAETEWGREVNDILAP
jgi:hypothetical protein